ncbi:hypothetical protein ACFLRW_07470 [Acidobacteriota bacterium]
MIESIYYKEEAISLAFRMALELFRTEEGNPEEIFERHKKMIMDLLEGKQVTSGDIVIDDKYEYEWSDKVAKKFCAQLTEHQRAIIKTIINGNGTATIKELEDGIKKANLRWSSNNTVGGALSGLSRKTLKQSIPYVWGYKDDKYHLTKQAEKFIKKYIDQ